MKTKSKCKHLRAGSCPNRVCEDVLSDGTPILTPRCCFVYEECIIPDSPPISLPYEDRCPYYIDSIKINK
jgi:hypothetical protein